MGDRKEESNLQEESLPAQKGGTPHNKIYKMTPALHISISGP